MADKTIAQLAGLTGNDVAPNDLLPVWDASGSVTKSVSVADLKRAVDLATDTSALTLAAFDGSNDAAGFTFNAKPLLTIGSSNALGSQLQSTPFASSAITDNAVCLYNPKGNVRIQPARSDTSATGVSGSLTFMSGFAATGSDLAGGNVTVSGGTGDGSGSGGVATVQGGAAGSMGAGGAASVSGGAGGTTSGPGGSVTIRGGAPTDGNGGSVAVLGRNGAGTNRSGGSVSIAAGNGTGSAAGGGVSFQTGMHGDGVNANQFYWCFGNETAATFVHDSANNAYRLDVLGPARTGDATANGRNFGIWGGDGGSTSGNGGNLEFKTGSATDGNGGSAYIIASNGTGTNRDGGSVAIAAGNATGSGMPGNVSILAGDSTSTFGPTRVSIGARDSSLALTDTGEDSVVDLTLDGKNLLRAGSLFAMWPQMTGGPVTGDLSSQNSVALHSPRGILRINAGNSATTANGKAGNLQLYGGFAAAGSGQRGGSVILSAGAGNGPGNGGPAFLHAGNAGSSGNGGDVTIQGGDAAAGNGGSVTVAAGNATGSDAPGKVSILAGSSTSIFSPTGVFIGAGDSSFALTDTGIDAVADLTLDGKNLLRIGSNFTMWPQMTGVSVMDEVGSQNGVGLYNPRGSLRINAGNSSTTANGKAAALQLHAGFAAAGSGLRGGGVTLSGGFGDGPGNGGPMFLNAGSAGSTGNGGDVTIQGGEAIAGDGGSVFLAGRAAAGTDRNGGSVTIASGIATGTGIPGDIVLNPATGGHVALNGTLRFADGSQMASAVATRHVATFNADSDWSAASGGYHTLTVPAAVHGRGTAPLVQLHELDGGDHDLIQGDRLQVRANGDIVLHAPDTPDGRFAGRLIIL